MYMSVGIAERDVETGLAYNSAVLLGPKGVIGKYRKIGLNPQDQKVFAPGNTGVEVFDTPIGRIGLVICYDDTYWQYPRLNALRGAEIIGWHSVSDRVMPGTPAAEATGNHSTVSNVQSMSAENGVWVVAATRSGIETNPITGGKLYYNGGSSLWSPEGRKLTQAPVVPPEELAPGLHGVFSATITPSDSDAVRGARLALRRPALYLPLLALHRSPVDGNATAAPRRVSLVGVQWPEGPSLLNAVHPDAGALTVLPELSGLPSGLSPVEIKARAERKGGAFEQALSDAARAGKGYLVGSYPERDGELVYHTVVLAGPDGAILGRYRATHPDADHASWAAPGDGIVVIPTPLGRIGLVSADELAVPELGALYAAMRADILAAPAGPPEALKVEVDAKLYAVPDPPTGRADFFPYAAAQQDQVWIVSGGRRDGDHTAAAIYGPEPVVSDSDADRGRRRRRGSIRDGGSGAWDLDQPEPVDRRPAGPVVHPACPSGTKRMSYPLASRKRCAFPLPLTAQFSVFTPLSSPRLQRPPSLERQFCYTPNRARAKGSLARTHGDERIVAAVRARARSGASRS